MYIKSFWGQKGGSSEPLEPPLPTGLGIRTCNVYLAGEVVVLRLSGCANDTCYHTTKWSFASLSWTDSRMQLSTMLRLARTPGQDLQIYVNKKEIEDPVYTMYCGEKCAADPCKIQRFRGKNVEWVLCEQCNSWLHAFCEHVTKQELKLIRKYICHNCKC